MRDLIRKLISERALTHEEFVALIEAPDSDEPLRLAADRVRREVFGGAVFIRGLIEVGNICRNDCLYCGIRRSQKCERYRLSDDEILESCRVGYPLGFRTFVLQSGEGSLRVGEICRIVDKIRTEFPDCAITLSLGEYSRADYAEMKKSGADRYLLRHETATKSHYERLHPAEMSFENRMRCLADLRELGFQVGCGFMVGSPFQTVDDLARDLTFIAEFSPEMCGIGPFIPAKGTPLEGYPAGSIPLTLKLLSLLRLIKPTLLLPATTALGSLREGGREDGLRAGANVVMPNLSPESARAKYNLYNNKLSSGNEAAENLRNLKASVKTAGYEIVTARGDAPDIRKD